MTNPKDKQSGKAVDSSRQMETSSGSAPPSTDRGVEGQMQAARKGMGRYPETLKELAEYANRVGSAVNIRRNP